MTAPLVDCFLRIPDGKDLYEQIQANAAVAKRMATQDRYKGRSVVICGAGPSLRDQMHHLPHAQQVWGCNSALPFLAKNDVRVTHGFCIDQGTAMLEEWGETFDVRYYVASSVHPDLAKHLIADGRRLTWFHSFLGVDDPPDWIRPEKCPPKMPYEMWLYTSLYPTSVQVGHGLNSVPRAVCLALFLGFSTIYVVGADCACIPDAPPMPLWGTPEYPEWMKQLVFYADGRTAAECYGGDALMAEAPNLDGRRWHTRADMVISARHLLELEAAYPGRIVLVGDTLPNAIRGKDAEWMKNLPSLDGVGKVGGFGNASEVYKANHAHEEAAV
jgi:hypothetical protein